MEQYTVHPPQVSTPPPFYLLQGSSWELFFLINEWTIVSPFKDWKKSRSPLDAFRPTFAYAA